VSIASFIENGLWCLHDADTSRSLALGGTRFFPKACRVREPAEKRRAGIRCDGDFWDVAVSVARRAALIKFYYPIVCKITWPTIFDGRSTS